jgi:hypothetical protein
MLAQRLINKLNYHKIRLSKVVQHLLKITSQWLKIIILKRHYFSGHSLNLINVTLKWTGANVKIL